MSYEYDSAFRVKQVTDNSTLAKIETRIDQDSFGNDQLSAFTRSTYNDGAQKVVTSRSWFDGTGRIIRSGIGSGPSPVNYDMKSTIYDHVGRPLRQKNPFVGDINGNGTTTFETMNTYDELSRVKQVRLPDSQIIVTTYGGSMVTVTDQVGRQRKSQVDGLGRLKKVFEQDPATGDLTWVTNYSYDALNNLTQIEQGGQFRLYKYDAASRLLYEKTPEQEPKINEAGGSWTAKYTYLDSGQIDRRTDARGAVTDYDYD